MNESYNRFLESIIDYAPEYKIIIDKAFQIAKYYHDGKFRDDGMPYVTHSLEVATILSNRKADVDTIIACLLHDTLEDTSITKDIIINEFGSEVYELVDGVTKIKNKESLSPQDAKSASIRKLIISISKDMRIITIKLADRLHNMRTLQYKPKNKQIEIAKETMQIYVPFAEKIGAFEIKCELEDLSLMYINPEDYQQLFEGLQQFSQSSEGHLKLMTTKISELLNNKNIPNIIKIKAKNIYEIYLRRLNSKSAIEDIPNVFFLNVIVNDFQNCYQTLGWIHSLYTPIDDMTRFYITNPKYPMHHALHTTIINDNRLIQAQIKTNEMDLLSNDGLIAFWRMTSDDVRAKMQLAYKDRFSTYSSLEEISEMTIDDSSFVERIKQEILSSDIVVFTPNGEKIILPSGSTVIDFAYQIHSEMGNHLASVRINDANESIYYVLKNNDRVRIITAPDEISCEIDWLDHIKTSRAHRSIRETLKRKEANQVLSL